MKIVELAECLQHTNTVARWLIEEWPDDDLTVAARKHRLLSPADCPPTLLAISEDTPLGVLAFARFVRTSGELPSLFIDALYVHPIARRRGVGSALVQAGAGAAASVARELFVYTKSPDWYHDRGWSVIRSEADSGFRVLRRDLLCAQQIP